MTTERSGHSLERVLDIAIDSNTNELCLDGVWLTPKVDPMTGDAVETRSNVWNLFHYLNDLRSELVAWRMYGKDIHKWTSEEPREPVQSARRWRPQ